eukprot:TRINITY_DN17_c0_g2_i1.p1 TRINITY_DN17_c0_g2~~TRINITY_DN17_c0_g2_i1.p1  ORF type:complete len:300 (+),score=106.19 TRINITY_DN17_c0_g2_i1:61-900(+)
MMMKLALVLLSACAVSGAGIGDRLFRTYTRYVSFPTTVQEAMAGGWVPLNGGACDARYGVPYVNGTRGLGKHNPTLLYFSRTGEVSGITVDVHGAAPPQKLIDMRFFEKQGDMYRIGVSFRADPCTTTSNGTYPIGDRAVVSPGGANISLPLTVAAAEAQKWSVGSCFYGMGTHYFYDLTSAPVMSWKAENVLPIVTMFNNNGDIQAFFFASWTVQEQIGDANDWEPVPLPNDLMCKNMCDPACTFAGTSFWSTYHVYLRDLNLATCPNNCTISCCDKQ